MNTLKKKGTTINHTKKHSSQKGSCGVLRDGVHKADGGQGHPVCKGRAEGSTGHSAGAMAGMGMGQGGS